MSGNIPKNAIGENAATANEGQRPTPLLPQEEVKQEKIQSKNTGSVVQPPTEPPKSLSEQWEGKDYTALRLQKGLKNYDITRITEGSNLAFPSREEFDFDGPEDQKENTYKFLQNEFKDYQLGHWTAQSSNMKRMPEGVLAKHLNSATFGSENIRSKDQFADLTLTGSDNGKSLTEEQQFDAMGTYIDTDNNMKTLNEYFNSKKGDKNVLIQDFDEEGNKTFRAVDRNKALDMHQIRSAYGPAEFTSNPAISFGKGFYEGFVTSSVSTVGSLTEITGDLFDKWNSDDKWTDDFGHRMRNWASEQSAMNEDERVSLFESFPAFMAVTGQGVASIAQMIAMGGAANVVGKAAVIGGMKAGAKGLATRAGARSALKGVGIASREVALVTGSAVMTDATYKEAKSMGLSDKESAMLGAIAGVTTYGVEKFIGPGLDINYWATGGGKAALRSSIKSAQSQLGKGSSAEVKEKGAKAFIKGVKKSYQEALDKGMTNKGVTALTMAIEEGGEEMVEQFSGNLFKNVHDIHNNHLYETSINTYNKELQGYNNSLGQYEVKESAPTGYYKMGMGGKTVWAKDKVGGGRIILNDEEYAALENDKTYYKRDANGKQNIINKQTYDRKTQELNDNVVSLRKSKPQPTEVGKGKFSDRKGMGSLLEGTTEGMGEAFAGALLPGALFGVMKPQRKATLRRFVAEGKSSELYLELDKMHKQGALGPKGLDINGEPLKKGAVSANDFIYNEFQTEIGLVQQEVAADGVDAVLEKEDLKAKDKDANAYDQFLSDTRGEYLANYGKLKDAQSLTEQIEADTELSVDEKTTKIAEQEQVVKDLQGRLDYFQVKNEAGVTEREMDALNRALLENKADSNSEIVLNQLDRISTLGKDFKAYYDKTYSEREATSAKNISENKDAISSLVETMMDSADADVFSRSFVELSNLAKNKGAAVSDSQLAEIQKKAEVLKESLYKAAGKAISDFKVGDNVDETINSILTNQDGDNWEVLANDLDGSYAAMTGQAASLKPVFGGNGLADNLAAPDNTKSSPEDILTEYFKEKIDAPIAALESLVNAEEFDPLSAAEASNSAAQNANTVLAEFRALANSVGAIKAGIIDGKTLDQLPVEFKEAIKNNQLHKIDYINSFPGTTDSAKAALNETNQAAYQKLKAVNEQINKELVSFEARQQEIRVQDVRARVSLLLSLGEGIVDEQTMESLATVLTNNIDRKTIGSQEALLLAAEQQVYEYAQKNKKAFEKKAVEVAALKIGNSSQAYSNAGEYNGNDPDQFLLDNPFNIKPTPQSPLTAPQKLFMLMYYVDYVNKISKLNPATVEHAFARVVEDKKISPSVEQFENAKSALAMVVDGSASLTNAISKSLADHFKDMGSNAIYMRGPAGAGKSMMIPGLTVSLFMEMQEEGKDAPIVRVYAPSKDLSDKVTANMQNLFGIDVLTSKELKEGASTIDLDENSIVFIDEASLLTKEQILAINKNLENNNSATVIFLGDQLQGTSGDSYAPIEDFYQRSVGLNYIYRSGVVDLWNLQKTLREAFYTEGNAIPWTPLHYNPEAGKGVRVVNDIRDVVKNFKKDDRGVIVFDNLDQARFLLGADFDAFSDRVYTLSQGMIDNKRNTLVQGSDFMKVYLVTDRANYPKTGKSFLRALLTGATRATDYVEMFVPDVDPKDFNRVGPITEIKKDDSQIASQQATLKTRSTDILEGVEDELLANDGDIPVVTTEDVDDDVNGQPTEAEYQQALDVLAPLMNNNSELTLNELQEVYEALGDNSENVLDISKKQNAKTLYKELTDKKNSLEPTQPTSDVKEIKTFVDRISKGETIDADTDKQFYENNKSEIEKQLTEKINEKPTQQSSEVEEKISEVIKNKEFIKLSKDEKTYINTKTGQVYQRVTTFIADSETESGPLLKASQIIGTKVDELVRDFFAGKLKDLSEYDVSSNEEITVLLESLQKTKDTMDSRGEKVLANDIVLYNDEIGVAGQVDILTYDNKGNVRIYDMKTMRDNNFLDKGFGPKYDSTAVFEVIPNKFKANGDPKYRVVKGASQDSKRTKHTKQLSLYRILLNNTHGLKAETLAIMPIEINYNVGDTTTSKLIPLKGVVLIPLNKVKNAEIKDSKPTQQSSEVETPAVIATGPKTFLPSPNEDGTFDGSYESQSFKKSESVYELRSLGNGEYEFDISKDETTVQRALSYADVFIDPVADWDMNSEESGKFITTIKKGKLQKTDKGFEVIEKPIFKVTKTQESYVAPEKLAQPANKLTEEEIEANAKKAKAEMNTEVKSLLETKDVSGVNAKIFIDGKYRIVRFSKSGRGISADLGNEKISLSKANLIQVISPIVEPPVIVKPELDPLVSINYTGKVGMSEPNSMTTDNTSNSKKAVAKENKVFTFNMHADKSEDAETRASKNRLATKVLSKIRLGAFTDLGVRMMLLPDNLSGVNSGLTLGLYVTNPTILKEANPNMKLAEIKAKGLDHFSTMYIPNGAENSSKWRSWMNVNRAVLSSEGVQIGDLDVNSSANLRFNKTNKKIPLNDWLAGLTETELNRSNIMQAATTENTTRNTKTFMVVSRDTKENLSNISEYETWKSQTIFLSAFKIADTANKVVAEYITQLEKSLDDILNLKNLKTRKDIERHEAYQFIRYNASAIKQWEKKNPELYKELNLISDNTGRLKLGVGKGSEVEIAEQFRKDIKTLFEHKDSPFNLKNIKAGKKTPGLILAINPIATSGPNDTQIIEESRLEMNASTVVNMPHLKVSIDEADMGLEVPLEEGESSSPNKRRDISRGSDNIWKPKRNNTGSPVGPYISKEQAMKKASYLLGEKFVETHLEFVENLLDNDGRLHGMVHNGYMKMDMLANGMVSLPSLRHEIVHVAIGTLTPAQKKKLIKSISSTQEFKDSLDGIRERQKNPNLSAADAAEEWLAENYENNINYVTDIEENKNTTGLKGFVKKFVSFINRILSVSYRNKYAIESFYYSLDNKEFVDKSSHSSNPRLKRQSESKYNDAKYVQSLIPSGNVTQMLKAHLGKHIKEDVVNLDSTKKAMSIKQSIAYNRLDYMESEILPIYLDNNEVITLEKYLTNPGEYFERLNDNENNYKHLGWALLKTDSTFYYNIVKSIFPNFSMADIEGNEEEIQNEFVAGETQETEGRSIIVDKDNIDIFDTISDNVKFFIGGMGKRTYEKNPDTGRVLSVNELIKRYKKNPSSATKLGKGVVEESQAFYALRPVFDIAYRGVALSGLAGEDTDMVDAFRSSLKAVADSGDVTSSQTEDLINIYSELFDSRLLPKGSYSLYDYIHNETLRKANPDKAKIFEQIMYDLMTWGYQNYKENVMINSMNPYTGEFKSYQSRSNWQKDIIRGFKTNLASNYNVSGDGHESTLFLDNRVMLGLTGLTIDKEASGDKIIAKEEPNRVKYQVKRDGLYTNAYDVVNKKMMTPNKILNFSGANISVNPEIDPGLVLNEISSALRFMGYDINHRAIKKIFYSKGREGDQTNRQMLFEMVGFGMMILSTHAKRQSKSLFRKDLSTLGIFNKVLKDKFKSPSQLSDLFDSDEIQISNEVKGLYTLNDIFSYTEMLAKAQAELSGMAGKNQTFLASGKKKNTDKIASYLDRIFTNGNNGVPSDASIKNKIGELVNKIKNDPILAEKFKDNVLLKNLELNPLAYNGLYQIQEVVSFGGLKSSTGQNSDFNRMTDIDLMNDSINQYGLSLRKSNKDQVVDIRFNTIGDSGRSIYFKVKFDEDIVRVSQNDKKLSINEVKYDAVAKHLDRIFRGNQAKADNSIEKMRRVLDNSPYNQFVSPDTTNADFFGAFLNNSTVEMDRQKEYPAFVDFIKRSELLLNTDYVIEDTGRLIMGNSVKGYYGNNSNDIINHKNSTRLKKSKNRQAVIQDMFKKRYHDFGTKLFWNGHKTPDYVETSEELYPEVGEEESVYHNKFWQASESVLNKIVGQQERNEANIERDFQNSLQNTKDATYKVEGTLHPFYESLYLSNFINNYYVNDMLGTSHQQFKNIDDYYKRIKSIAAPTTPVLTGIKGGIKGIKNIAIVGGATVQLEEDNIQNGKATTIERADGGALLNPIFDLAKKVTSRFITGDDVEKPMGTGVDYTTGSGIQIKYSRDKITSDLIDLSSAYEGILETMLSGRDERWKAGHTDPNDTPKEEWTLVHHYYNNKSAGMSYDENMQSLYELVMDPESDAGYYEMMIHEIVDPTAVKYGASNINTVNLDGVNNRQGIRSRYNNLSIKEVDARYTEAIQLNPDRNSNDEQARNPSQISNIMPFGDVQTANTVNVLSGKLMDLSFGDNSYFAKAMDAVEAGDFKLAGQELKEMALESQQNSYQIGKIIEMLRDNEMNANFPVIRSTIMKTLASKLKNIARYHLTGSIKVQSPDTYIKVYQSEDGSGGVYTSKEAEGKGLKPRDLVTDSIKVQVEGESERNVTSRKDLETLILESKSGKKMKFLVQPGEVVMGVNEEMAKDLTNNYGIEKGWTIARAYQIEVENENGGIELIDFRVDDVDVKGKYVTDARFKGKGDIKAAIDEYRSKLAKRLIVLTNRTPSHNLGTARRSKIVSLLWDKSSTIYTSPIKSIFDGSDFDVDQLTVYGITANEGESNKLKNQITETLLNAYANPTTLSLEMMMTPLSMAKIADLKNIAKRRTKGGSSKFYDITTDHDIHEAASTGSAMVGAFANGIKASANLSFAYQNSLKGDSKLAKQIDSLFPGISTNKTDVYRSTEFMYKAKEGQKQKEFYYPESTIIATFGEFLNAALDNQKELILNYLGVNQDSANIVMSMIASGLSIPAIYGLLNNYQAKGFFNSLKKQRSLTLSHKRISTLDSYFAAAEKVAKRNEQFDPEKDNKKVSAIKNQINDLINDNVNDAGETTVKGAELRAFNKEVKKLKASLTIAEERANDDSGSESQQRDYKRFQELESYIEKGEIFNRISTISGLNQGFNSDDFKANRLIKDIEFYTGQTLESFESEFKTTSPYANRSKYMLPQEQKKFAEMEDSMRSKFDMNAFVELIPNQKKYIQLLRRYKTVRNSFSDKSGVIRGVESQVLRDIKAPGYKYASQYYGFSDAMNKVAISLYSERELKKVGLPNILDGVKWGDSDNGKIPFKQFNHNLSTPDGSTQFLMAFGLLVDSLKGSMRGKNAFLDALTVLRDASSVDIQLNGNFDLSDEKRAEYELSFKNLQKAVDSHGNEMFSDVDWKRAFEIYEMTKYKLSFKAGAISDVIGYQEYKKLSSYMETFFEKDLAKLDNEILSESIIGNEDNLKPYVSLSLIKDYEKYYDAHSNSESYFHSAFDENNAIVEENPMDYKKYIESILPKYSNRINKNKKTEFVRIEGDSDAQEISFYPLYRMFSRLGNAYSSKVGTMSEKMESIGGLSPSTVKELLNDGSAFIPIKMQSGTKFYNPNRKHNFIKIQGFENIYNVTSRNAAGIMVRVQRNMSIYDNNINTSAFKIASREKGGDKQDIIKASKMIGTSKAIGSDTLDFVVKKLADKFKVKIIKLQLDEISDEKKNWRGWIHNGTMYLNMDKVKADTPIHEFTHIFLQAIKQSSPKLYNQLLGIAKTEMNDSSNLITQKIKANYDETGNDLLEEYISTVIGYASQEVILKKDQFSGIISKIKEFWEAVKQLFSGSIASSGLSNFDFGNSSLYEFGLLFADLAINKRQQRLFENIVPTGRVSASKPFLQVLNSLDLETYLIRGDDSKNFGKNSASVADSIMRQGVIGKAGKERRFWDKMKGETISLSGVSDAQAEITVKEYTDSLFEIKDELPLTIVEAINESETNQDFVDFFTDTDSDTKNGNVLSLSRSDITNLGRHFRKSPTETATVVKAGDTIKIDGKNYEVPLYFSDQFVIVQNQEGGPVSIYNITHESINQSGGNLFFDLSSGLRAKENLYMSANPGNMKRLNMGLLLTDIKSKIPNVEFNDTEVMSLFGDRFSHNTAYMTDVLPYIKYIAKTEELRSMMPAYMAKTLKDSLNMTEFDFNQNIIKAFASFAKGQEELSGVSELIGDDGSYDLLDLKNGVAKFIQEKQIGQTDENAHDKAYNMAASMLLFLDKQENVAGYTNKRGDASWGSGFLNAPNQQSDIYKWAQNQIRVGSARIMNVMHSFVDEHSAIFKKISDAKPLSLLRRRTQDVGSEYFNSLFKKRTIDGKNVDTREIHYTLSDPETKEAFDKGEITAVQLEYAKFFLDKVESTLMDFIKHKKRMEKGPKYWNNHDLEGAAKEKYKRIRGAKGTVPFIHKSTLENFSEMLGGEFKGSSAKQFFNKIWDNAVNPYKLFDDEFSGKKSERTRYTEVFNSFTSQFGSSTPYGSDGKLAKMGLIYTDGKLELLDDPIEQAKNNYASQDLAQILNMFVISYTQEIEIESKTLPAVNAARHLYYVQEAQGIPNKNNIKMLDNLINTYAHKDFDDVLTTRKIGNTKVDAGKALSVFIQATTFAGLAYNGFVGLLATIQNTVQILTHGITNDLVNSNMAGAKDLFRASLIVSKNLTKGSDAWQKGGSEDFKKMNAIMDWYKVADISESSSANDYRHSLTKKTLFTSYHAHWLGFQADYWARGTLLIAQMMKEGAWEAHSLDSNGKLQYDETKDKRYYSNGKITKEGAALKAVERVRMIEDGLMSRDDEKLPRAYSSKTEMRLKDIADKYILGYYGSTERAPKEQENIFWYSVAQFRRWLPAKLANYYGRATFSDERGQDIITYDKDGNIKVKWQRNMNEGKINTVVHLFQELSIVKHDLESAKKVWNDLHPERKRNIAKMIVDAATLTLMMLLFNGIVDDDDDDDMGFIPSNKLTQTVMYGVMDLAVVVNQNEAKRILENPIPSINTLFIFGEMFFQGDMSRSERLVPFKSTYDGTSEIVNQINNAK
jgi:hypothetical protein